MTSSPNFRPRPKAEQLLKLLLLLKKKPQQVLLTKSGLSKIGPKAFNYLGYFYKKIVDFLQQLAENSDLGDFLNLL